MAFRRLSMRKIKEVLRLCWGNGLTARQSAKSLGVARSTLKDYLDRAKRANLSWPLPENLDESSLENMLFPSTVPLSTERRNIPSFDYIFKELTRKHVTMQLLWHEYREKNPDGYQYSQFCLRYRHWKKTLDISCQDDFLLRLRIISHSSWGPINKCTRSTLPCLFQIPIKVFVDAQGK
jgi:hypothetical protein